eukprot:GHVL01033019.1.p1 GENE.GHVL01033019.1~~GHVL01033019.1.p1  ORF type:complete len:301 (-),score=43.15 GHVL01033019.1:1145-2047(-)
MKYSLFGFALIVGGAVATSKAYVWSAAFKAMDDFITDKQFGDLLGHSIKIPPNEEISSSLRRAVWTSKFESPLAVILMVDNDYTQLPEQGRLELLTECTDLFCLTNSILSRQSSKGLPIVAEQNGVSVQVIGESRYSNEIPLETIMKSFSTTSHSITFEGVDFDLNNSDDRLFLENIYKIQNIKSSTQLLVIAQSTNELTQTKRDIFTRISDKMITTLDNYADGKMLVLKIYLNTWKSNEEVRKLKDSTAAIRSIVGYQIYAWTCFAFVAAIATTVYSLTNMKCSNDPLLYSTFRPSIQR